MYLQVTHLPGSISSQSTILLAAPKLPAKINDKMKYDPSSQLPPPYHITEALPLCINVFLIFEGTIKSM